MTTKTATATAPVVTPELVFTTGVPIPAKPVSASAMPNPFDGRFPADEEALSITVPGDIASTLVKRLSSQARKAASNVDRSARVSSVSQGKGKDVTTTLTLWTVKRITRTRKPLAPVVADGPAPATTTP